jgi:transcriptional regulator with XRE-family HTH domain
MKSKLKTFIRETKGMSLYRLSQEMRVPQQTVYSWATNRTIPDRDHMDYLCSFLDCGLDDLFEIERMSSDELQKRAK